jgi:hypothetical protein
MPRHIRIYSLACTTSYDIHIQHTILSDMLYVSSSRVAITHTHVHIKYIHTNNIHVYVRTYTYIYVYVYVLYVHMYIYSTAYNICIHHIARTHVYVYVHSTHMMYTWSDARTIDSPYAAQIYDKRKNKYSAERAVFAHSAHT